jgi:hypothetical protein
VLAELCFGHAAQIPDDDVAFAGDGGPDEQGDALARGQEPWVVVMCLGMLVKREDLNDLSADA